MSVIIINDEDRSLQPTSPLTDFVSDDDDDMFPGSSGLSSSRPDTQTLNNVASSPGTTTSNAIILLPPSHPKLSSEQMHEASNAMEMELPAIRKRKRYGSGLGNLGTNSSAPSKKRSLVIDLTNDDDDHHLSPKTIIMHPRTAAISTNTITGRALDFVHAMIEVMRTRHVSDEYEHQVCLLSTDALVFQAEAMMEVQERWMKEGKRPLHVDIGYHYTQEQNIESVKRNGLLNREERKINGIYTPNYNGASYGEGIYTGNDPIRHMNYGSVGLVVVRLKGIEGHLPTYRRNHNYYEVKNYQVNNNCIVNTNGGMIILQHSYQCMALLRYPTKDLSSRIANSQILKDVQNIVEKYFNFHNVTTPGADMLHLAKRQRKLEDQFLDNIRKQQQLMKSLMESKNRIDSSVYEKNIINNNNSILQQHQQMIMRNQRLIMGSNSNIDSLF